MSRKIASLAGILIWIAGWSVPAGAATITWTNAAGGDWGDAANWSPDQVPGSGDDAVITAAGTYTVTVHGTRSAGSLVLGGNLSSPWLLVEGQAPISARLTVGNSITNQGTIELSNASAGYQSTLDVKTGLLLNETNGTILVSNGAGGGARNLWFELDNRGTVTLDYPAWLNESSAAHTNSGSFNVSADLEIELYSTGFENTGSMTLTDGAHLILDPNSLGSFTTSGTLALGSGNMTIDAGTFNYAGGTITGTGTQIYAGVTLNLTPDLSNAAAEIRLSTSTVNGPGTLINATGRTLLLQNVTCHADLLNQADLTCRGNIYLNGGFASLPGTTLKVEGRIPYHGHLRLANTYTNVASIELVNATANYGASLTVNGGPLVNETTGSILVSSGAGGGLRHLLAELNNRGTVTIQEPCLLNKSSASHTNSGSFNVAADLEIELAGSTHFENSGSMTFTDGADLFLDPGTVGAFTTSGTLALGGGNMTIDAGTFNYAGGTITGTGTQIYAGVTLNLTPDLSNAAAEIRLSTSTVNGPGTLINAAGRTLLLQNVTCHADLLNQADLTCRGNIYLNGGFASLPGTTLKVEGRIPYHGHLRLADTYTNVASIELVNATANYGASLTVNGGPLVNETTGSILVSSGAGGGLRHLLAELNNRGTVTIQETCLLNKSSASHTNSGSFNVAADLEIELAGSTHFENSGSMTFTDGADLFLDPGTVGAFTTSGTLALGGGNMTIDAGTFNYAGGTITGTGTQTYAGVTLNLTPDLSNAAAEIRLSTSTVNGPGTLINATGRALLLQNVTCHADLLNQADLTCRGNIYLNGGFASLPGTTLKVEGRIPYHGHLRLADTYTNVASIELVNATANYGASLTVNGGPLVNETTGSILVSSGAGGGLRHLLAELNNRGTVTIQEPCLLNKSSASHTNAGTFNVSADLEIELAGSTHFENSGSMTFTDGADLFLDPGTVGAFTTSGTLALGGGNMTIDAGTFNYAGGTITGTGTQIYAGVTLNLTPDLSNAAAEIRLSTSTVNGPGTLINATGRAMLLQNVTCHADLLNQADLTCRGNIYLNGGFASLPGTTLKVEGRIPYHGHLRLADSYTNVASIELVNATAGYGADLTVSGGPLVNESTGTILVSSGAGGGGRNLFAQLDNRGTVTVNQTFVINRAGADHSNSGLLVLDGAGLSVIQSGATPTFSNSGTLDIGASRTMTVTAGAFNSEATGTIKGEGTLDVAGTSTDLAGSGRVAPGSSPGILYLTGDFNPDAGNVLEVEIGGPTPGSDHDRFVVSGAANLDGAVDATLVNGFAPVQYDSFVVATFASRSGTFPVIRVPAPHLYGWSVDYTNTSVSLTVVNTAPTFDPIDGREVGEETELSVDASATDTDIPPQTLTYSLLSPPSGAAIDSGTGAFTWTPTEVQGPGTNVITVRVVDDGAPNLSATNQFEVIVDEVNVPPVMDPVPDATIHADSAFSVVITATDADIPSNTLTFGLAAGPVGAAVDGGSGLFTWDAMTGDAGTTNLVMVEVSDDGMPVLSDTNGFTLIVVDPLAFTSMQSHPTGTVQVTWNAISGATYRVSYAEDLAVGVWSNLVPDVTASGGSASTSDSTASNAAMRAYDVRQLE